MHEKLKANMDRKGITQRELAEKIGVHRVSFNRKMCGKREWLWSEIISICKVLDIENPIGYFDIKRK